MKQTLEQLLSAALQKILPELIDFGIQIDRSKTPEHGDFATNIALMLAKSAHKPPRVLAEAIVAAIPEHPNIQKITIAGPGFINFFLKNSARAEIISRVLTQGEQFGQCDLGQGQRVLVEYVSANPTGPLHVGHGRGAAFGASLANLLEVAGFEVSREYYVNDAGRQMSILAASVWLRYLALYGEAVVFPANAYRGDYVVTIAEKLRDQQAHRFLCSWQEVVRDLPQDEPEGGDKELYIDALIERAKGLLTFEGFRSIHQAALTFVLDDIKADLAEFGVYYDAWFSEQSLLDSGAIQQAISALKASNYTYEQAGALWFKSTQFGDEKDRVLIRANGQNTYFAADVAYHWNKYQRGFSRLVDLFGADHHGYITRIKSAMKALCHDEEALHVFLVQFAILYRSGQRIPMSTRSGSFVTLRELRSEVGNDAARFFYVMRKPEQHMDFDLDLAKSESNDNPVYYIQYAHARICSVQRQLDARGLALDEDHGLQSLARLNTPQEHLLMDLLGRYPEMILHAAEAYEPHQIAYYLRELANGLHSYYNAVPLLCEESALRNARLCLLKATKQVIRNGLQLLSVSSPESM
jgi:arginyl-tRNA synthetase